MIDYRTKYWDYKQFAKLSNSEMVSPGVKTNIQHCMSDDKPYICRGYRAF